MLRFLALYACFVGPVLKALYHETAVGVAEIKAPAADASLAAIASWYASVLGCSATLRTATRRLQLRHDRRSEAQAREDMLHTAAVATVLGWPGRVVERISLGVVHAESGLGFLPLLALFLLTFTLLFEATEQLTHLTLTAELLRQPGFGLAVVLASLLIIGWLVLHHVALARSLPDGGALYGGCVALGVGLHAALFLWPAERQARLHTHLHHWYWPVPLSLLCQFTHSQASLLVSALFAAISLHGCACFGAAPVFTTRGRAFS